MGFGVFNGKMLIFGVNGLIVVGFFNKFWLVFGLCWICLDYMEVFVFSGIVLGERIVELIEDIGEFVFKEYFELEDFKFYLFYLTVFWGVFVMVLGCLWYKLGWGLSVVA